MTDDLTPDAISELASGYLDGELTADERAMVEHDATLLAEVDRRGCGHHWLCDYASREKKATDSPQIRPSTATP